jgi:cytochrome c-type biogenesis protein CcmF
MARSLAWMLAAAIVAASMLAALWGSRPAAGVPFVLVSLAGIFVVAYAMWRMFRKWQYIVLLPVTIFPIFAVWMVGVEFRFMVILGLALAVWIALAALTHLFRQAKATQGDGSLLASLARQPLHFWGMHLAHIGVAVFVAGVTIVGAHEEEKDVKMAPGDSVRVAGYSFRLLGVKEVQGPNYTAWQGEVELSRDGRFQRRLHPEKRFYASSAMPMTEAAIDAGVLRDVYVSLGEPIDRARPEGEWAVRVYYKPLVDWIWGGCTLMALGGLLAAFDRRYRNKARKTGKTPL